VCEAALCHAPARGRRPGAVRTPLGGGPRASLVRRSLSFGPASSQEKDGNHPHRSAPMPTLACPACSAKFLAPDHLRGRSILCPKCRTKVAVPRGAGSAAERVIPVEAPDGSSPSSPVAKGAGGQWSVVVYWVRDAAKNVTGPFAFEELQRRANSNQLFPSWYVSTDRIRWTVAANVPKLFDVLEAALARELPAGKRLRDLTPAQQVALLVDRFVLRSNDFLARFGWLRGIRRYIAGWTLPKTIVLARVTASGAQYIRFDPRAGTETPIEQAQAEKIRSDKARRTSLIPDAVTAGLLLLWTVWVVANFSLTGTALKALAITGIRLVYQWWDVRRTKVLVGYDMDAATRARLAAVRNAFKTLETSSGVWLCRLERHRTAHERKLAAGMDARVSRMPAAVFSRAIPNVETNVRVMGLTFHDKAIYFLPENILVVEGATPRYVEYADFCIDPDIFDMHDKERRAYRDAECVGYVYRYPKPDGSPDTRFKDNYQDVPVYRFGRLILRLGAASEVDLLLSNRHVPRAFYDAYTHPPALPDPASSRATQEDGAEGPSQPESDPVEDKQSLSDWLKDVVIPAFKILGGLPRPVKAGVLVLACMILCAGGGYWLANADERALAQADELYDAGKHTDAAAVYRQYPRVLLRPDGSGGRYLRRLIESDLEKGDRAEARAWVEKAVEAEIKVEFNSPEATALYRQAKDEHDRRVAQQRAEEEARRKAAEEEERRRREDQRRAEEEERQRKEAEAKQRAEEEARQRAEREAQARAERRRQADRQLRDLESTDARTRLAAIKGLEALGDDAAAASPDLVKRLGLRLQDSDRDVRRAAYGAVVQFGGGPKAAMPALTEALKNSNVDVRLNAAALLKGIGPEAVEATPALVDCLGDLRVRPEAVEALGRIGKPAVPALVTVLKGNDRVARLGAVQALSRIGPSAAEATPALIALLGDPDVRLEAVRTLGLIGKPAVPGLVKALDDGDEDVRRGAALTLGHIGPDAREATSKLTTLAQTDPSSGVREAAGIAVRRINP